MNSPLAFPRWQMHQKLFRIQLEFPDSREGGLGLGLPDQPPWYVLPQEIFVPSIASMYQLHIQRISQPDKHTSSLVGWTVEKAVVKYIPRWRDLPIHYRIRGFCVLVSRARSEGRGGFFVAEPLPNPQAWVPSRDPPERRLPLRSTGRMSTSSLCSGTPDRTRRWAKVQNTKRN